jgi:hypothetical protein
MRGLITTITPQSPRLTNPSRLSKKYAAPCLLLQGVSPTLYARSETRGAKVGDGGLPRYERLGQVVPPRKRTDVLERHLAAEPTAFVSRIGVVEMHSVLAGLVRTKELDVAAMELLRRKFRSDVRKNRFRVTTLGAKHYEKAENLLLAHGSIGLRTLDSLQLAVALDLLEHQIIDTFVAADRILCRVAPLVRLKTFNPEDRS